MPKYQTQLSHANWSFKKGQISEIWHKKCQIGNPAAGVRSPVLPLLPFLEKILYDYTQELRSELRKMRHKSAKFSRFCGKKIHQFLTILKCH